MNNYEAVFLLLLAASVHGDFLEGGDGYYDGQVSVSFILCIFKMTNRQEIIRKMLENLRTGQKT